MARDRKLAAAFGFAALTVATIYGALRLRNWALHWGANEEEWFLPLPGDDIVADPTDVTTRAITIDAPPEDVWPWMVQMGKGRGGLYSYDWLDQAFGYLDRPSSPEVLPQFQQLQDGDLIPMGRDGKEDDFYVHIARPGRALVIGAYDPPFRKNVSWAMVLMPMEGERTRLLVRVRYRVEPNLQGTVLSLLMEPASFIMLRKQMLNFKRLAERRKESRTLQIA